MTSLPTPSQLLGAGNFNEWYPGQFEVVEQALSWYDGPRRFLGTSVPTGSGKTLSMLLLSQMAGARTVILTATKGLQAQYMRDSAQIGAVEVKGQNNFPCLLATGLRADEGPCHDGLPCLVKEDCPYRRQLRAAQQAKLVITNYSYWMAQNAFSSGLGDTDLLVCDEGHQAFGSLEGFLTIFISRMDLQPMGLNFPDIVGEWGIWKSWAQYCLPTIEYRVSELDTEVKGHRSRGESVPNALLRVFRSTRATESKVRRLASLSDVWVVQGTRHGYRFIPKWVAAHSKYLFLDVPKVAMMSAILSKRSCAYLGVPDDVNLGWIEAPSHFPPENTPIWHIPTARMNQHTDDFGLTLWTTRMDQIIQRRLDRKGIVFTVSYERARLLMARSRFKDIMYSHGTADVVQVIEQFKKAKAPAVLLSPAVTTGYDFPANRYNIKYLIVGKIPYPDTTDPVTQARQAEDKSWSSYLAMETLIQECGRASRGPEDKVEVLITDDSWWWYWKNYQQFAPAWFKERVKGSLRSVPDPLV